jgi:hypothetical protein
MSESKGPKVSPAQLRVLREVATGAVRRLRTASGYKLAWRASDGTEISYADYWACAKAEWIADRGSEVFVVLTAPGQKVLEQALAAEAKKAEAETKKAEEAQIISSGALAAS